MITGMKRLLIGTTAAFVLAACSEEPAPAPVDVEAGKAFVETHCTGCHTLEGEGKTDEIPNLAAQPADYLVEAMDAYRDGTRKHSALRGLISGTTDEQVRNIAAYFSGLPPVREAPPSPSGEDVYAEGSEVAAVCATCHGRGGFSTTPGVPNLAGQHPMYLIVATQEYANGTRNNAEKEKMLRGLGTVDIEKMAMYFAAQAPEQRPAPPFGDASAGEAQTAVCGSCHGARGVGDDPMVPNLAGQEPHYLVNAIKAYRDQERSHEDMVADKSDAEIEDIAAYYAVQLASSVTGAGEQTSEIIAKCDRCHGQAAGQSTMVVPVLQGQKQEYLLRVMKEYRDGKRGNSMMHKMSAGYSDALLSEIAEHYATQPR